MSRMISLLLVLAAVAAAPAAFASGRVDINSCTYAELMTLPGIGPRLADAILEESAAHGDFRGGADLLRVKGIGPQLARKLAALVEFEGAAGPANAAPAADRLARPDAAPLAAASASACSTGPQKPAPASRLDLNVASEAQLAALPGIGPVYSRRIVEFRKQHGPYRSLSDLARVNGLAAARTAALRGLVTQN